MYLHRVALPNSFFITGCTTRKMSSPLLLPLLLLSLCIAIIAAAVEPSCEVALFRVVGANVLYALPCRCSPTDVFVARATLRIPDDVNDTVAQARATVTCLKESQRNLQMVCTNNLGHYEAAAREVLERCVVKTPAPDAPDQEAVYTYDKSQCKAVFRRADVLNLDRKESVLVCACEQPNGVVVHPGVSQFFQDGGELGQTQERDFIAACIDNDLQHLKDGCVRQPERFELLGLQLLNVCCKRARKMFPTDKLRCQETVPADVFGTQLDVGK